MKSNLGKIGCLSYLHTSSLTGLLLLLTGFLINSCAPQVTSDKNEDFNSTINGRVVDKNGDGLVGVTVTASPGGYSTSTTANGDFTVPDLEASEEEYTLHFHLVDYIDTSTAPIRVGLDEIIPLEKDIKLTNRYATIRGTVEDQSGTKLIGAGVVVEMQGILSQTFTGGEFILKDVEPGDVKLLSALEGAGTGLTAFSIQPEEEKSGITIIHNLEGGTLSGQLNEGESIIGFQKQTRPASGPMAFMKVLALGGTLSTTSDSMGYFTLKGVPSGGIVGLRMIYNEDTLDVGAVEVKEKHVMDMKSMVVERWNMVNNMALVPSTIMAFASDEFVRLYVNSKFIGAKFDHFLWDLNNDNDFELKTDVPMTSIPVPPLGAHIVKVKAINTDSVESETIVLRVVVEVAPDLAVFNRSLGILNGTIEFTGADEINPTAPLILGIYAASDLRLDSVLVMDTVTAKNGMFNLPLPAGGYTLAYFVDLNNDGKPNSNEPRARYVREGDPDAANGYSVIPVTADTVVSIHIKIAGEDNFILAQEGTQYLNMIVNYTGNDPRINQSTNLFMKILPSDFLAGDTDTSSLVQSGLGFGSYFVVGVIDRDSTETFTNGDYYKIHVKDSPDGSGAFSANNLTTFAGNDEIVMKLSLDIGDTYMKGAARVMGTIEYNGVHTVSDSTPLVAAYYLLNDTQFSSPISAARIITSPGNYTVANDTAQFRLIYFLDLNRDGSPNGPEPKDVYHTTPVVGLPDSVIHMNWNQMDTLNLMLDDTNIN